MKHKNKPTAQEVANIAGVSLTLVNRKLAQGRSPRQIIAEAEAQAQQAAQRQPVVNVTDIVNGHGATYAEGQRRKELALAGLREVELQQLTGELAPVDDLRRWLHHIFVPLVQGFRALPAELRDMLTPGVAELLERRVEAVIRSADHYMQSCFQRAGQPLSDGALDVGDGWRVRWWIEPPPEQPVPPPS